MRALLPVALLLGPVPASAAEVVINDFVGTVTITQGSADVPVIRNETDALRITHSGERITVDGGHDDPADTGVCRFGSGGLEMTVNDRMGFGKRKKADRAFEAYPAIELTVPEGSTVRVRNSIVELDIEPLLQRADLRLEGCRNVRIGDALDATVRKSGSSGLVMGRIGALELRRSGAGDTEVDEIGSGELRLSGAGDLRIGRVGERVDIRRSGAGDIEIDEVEGALSYSASGAGNLDVGGGEVTELSIDKSGAGDVDINAPVGTAMIRASGAGSIDLDGVSGEYLEKLSGSVRVQRN